MNIVDISPLDRFILKDGRSVVVVATEPGFVHYKVRFVDDFGYLRSRGPYRTSEKRFSKSILRLVQEFKGS